MQCRLVGRLARRFHRRKKLYCEMSGPNVLRFLKRRKTDPRSVCRPSATTTHQLLTYYVFTFTVTFPGKGSGVAQFRELTNGRLLQICIQVFESLNAHRQPNETV